MKRTYIALLTLATGVTLLTSVATAGPSATKQRVEIAATGIANPSSALKFSLSPLSPGRLEFDSGTESSVVANQRTVTRDGETAQILTWITTCKGKRGSFVLRVRIAHVDAGNGFHIGTGTWRFVRGRVRTRGSREEAGSQTRGATRDPAPWARSATASSPFRSAIHEARRRACAAPRLFPAHAATSPCTSMDPPTYTTGCKAIELD